MALLPGHVPAAPHRYVLVTDGAARGNPGPAGLAWAVLDTDGEILFEGAKPIGRATNNEAEYRAVIAGLEELARVTDEPLLHVSDSELVVKQLSGEYRIRASNLAPLAERVRDLAARFSQVHHEQVPRTDDRIQYVDSAVNKVLDGHIDA